jgi:manganese/zinc/iron transport system substrate-binding protein
MTGMPQNRSLGSLLIFSLLVVFSASADPRPKILATTTIIADTAREIGGDRVTIDTLMGPGVDPHLYKASPVDLRRLLAADLVLHNGLHLEGKLSDVLESLKARKRVLAVADGIAPSDLRELPEAKDLHDPHIWFDVGLWQQASRTIAQALTELDPNGKDEYAAHLASFLLRLAALDTWIRSEVQKLPESRRILITAHDAFGYFGRAYGVKVLALQGISTESEASLRDVEGLVETIVSNKIPAVFFESSVPRKTIEALVQGSRSRGHEVKVGGELYSDALGDQSSSGATYEKMIRHNTATIVEALSENG